MTLQRTLEPEIMDGSEDAAQYDLVNHSSVNQAFVDDLITLVRTDSNLCKRLDDGGSGLIDVLDVGTATAQIPVQLCDQQPVMRVMAIDMAVNMLGVAAGHVGRADCRDRIQLAKVDAKNMSFESNSFDVVMSKSTIHHIPDPVVCLAEIARVCRPGGAVFIRDLMRPTDAETLELIARTYVGKESAYSQRLYRESLHAALSLEEIRDIVSSLGWDANDVCATSDRHWTWAAINRFGG